MGDSNASYFYIDKSLDDLKFIESHTKGIRYMDFAANDLLIYSVCFKFVQASESAKKFRRVRSRFIQTSPGIKLTG